jgi:hypothetical protein
VIYVAQNNMGPVARGKRGVIGDTEPHFFEPAGAGKEPVVAGARTAPVKVVGRLKKRSDPLCTYAANARQRAFARGNNTFCALPRTILHGTRTFVSFSGHAVEQGHPQRGGHVLLSLKIFAARANCKAGKLDLRQYTAMPGNCLRCACVRAM